MRGNFNDYIRHFWLGLFIAFISYFIWGCSPKERVVKEIVYQDVYIPVQCKADKPERPAYCGEIMKDTLNLLEYTEMLEKILSVCVGEKIK